MKLKLIVNNKWYESVEDEIGNDTCSRCPFKGNGTEYVCDICIILDEQHGSDDIYFRKVER